MYPNRELILLAARKAALRAEIARLRGECTAAAARATRPLVWLDRAADFVRQVSPAVLISALPLVAIARRAMFSRIRFLGPLLRWAPLVFTAARGFRTR